ncbi:MAG TPA: type II toxin-antitoxin system VapC family toxin [Acetobacteraceae bacterium]|nr:type II toxin-antitoxin system VapC family toxin [Acetobacteraceae bacterium]
MTLVVDASVACKWFIAESDSDAAEALLTGGQMLLAPDLIVPEVCNVAWLKLRRGEIVAEQATEMVRGLPDLLDELVPSLQLARRALEIVSSLAHPAYDCFYLALAEQRGTRVVTDDRRLLARLAATPWNRLVVRLAEAAAQG